MLGSAVLGLTLLAGSVARADADDAIASGGHTGPLMFAKIDGVDGDSTLKGHEREIQIFNFSETFRQSVATGGGSAGGSAGKFTPGPIVFTKVQDKASIGLLRACAKGQHLPTVVITAVRLTKGSPQDFYKITLKEVFVTAINEKSSGDNLVDEIQLVYGSARWEVFDPPDATEWDGKTGKVSATAPAPGSNR
jgi:type VI secretion system secreted protein Hcp